MPNADTTDIRNKARRVKKHILDKYLKFADRVDEKGEGDLSENEYKKYWNMTEEFARNVVPRSQEVTGEDGEAINVNITKYADNPNAPSVPAEAIPIPPPESI